MVSTSLTVRLAERPFDSFILGKHFYQEMTPMPSASDVRASEILVETLYLSIDSAMREWVKDERSSLPPVPIGGVMRGFAVARVLFSKSKLAIIGDLVTGFTGWSEHAILAEGAFDLVPGNPDVLAEPQKALSTFGVSSLAAWWGMTKIGCPSPGETIVISAAAGAVGSVAGQIAKIKGARVVGICGSTEKCNWLTSELGFDVALNYKMEDFESKFNEATGDLIDVYFDNVGGDILNMCLGRAKPRARFVECGTISQYNKASPEGPANFGKISPMRLRVEGFVMLDHMDQIGGGQCEVGCWVAEGKLRFFETIIKGGLQEAERALINLFNGVNWGKLLVEVKDPATKPTVLG
ncbi:NAD(P)-binding protein [Periconia macrospinosa]|uniref:NAD(P)-binding protein n=1 Tax=Periconia macrospinosa TaxID=97972 RepID=A0A2V1DB74_9PLEO|nr:NAD(P)-binding protein [Periconia macrospinosa]